eukprot:6467998-Amphidinium_carterae.1
MIALTCYASIGVRQCSKGESSKHLGEERNAAYVASSPEDCTTQTLTAYGSTIQALAVRLASTRWPLHSATACSSVVLQLCPQQLRCGRSQQWFDLKTYDCLLYTSPSPRDRG